VLLDRVKDAVLRKWYLGAEVEYIIGQTIGLWSSVQRGL